MERLNETAYSVTIMNLPYYSNLLNRSDRESSLEFMKREWSKTKANYGVETLRELIDFELILPRPKSCFDELSSIEKKDFWKKVEYVGRLLD